MSKCLKLVLSVMIILYSGNVLNHKRDSGASVPTRMKVDDVPITPERDTGIERERERGSLLLITAKIK